MDLIKIQDRFVGKNQPIFIIAEAGVNHNGDINLAKKLVDVASESGADAIKFQTFKAEDIATEEAGMAEYQKKNTGKEEKQLELLKRLELSEKNHILLKEYCKEKNIIFSSTPHSGTKDVDFLDNLGVSFFKIGSGDLTNLPYLYYIAEKNKPVIISTGMGDINEIMEAYEALNSTGNNKIIFLHCGTNYPLDDKFTNLRAINTIKNKINTLVGYSDHTTEISASILAVNLGACVIEKHFTLDKNLPGPDHKASLEPNELKDLVRAIRLIENKNFKDEEAIDFLNNNGFDLNPDIKQMLGNGIKEPFDFESKIAQIARKSVVAGRDIKAGKILNEDDLNAKRPGNGLSPKYMFGKYNRVIGKKLKVDLKKDQQIKLEYLE